MIAVVAVRVYSGALQSFYFKKLRPEVICYTPVHEKELSKKPSIPLKHFFFEILT
jgi:hypothetical protein